MGMSVHQGIHPSSDSTQLLLDVLEQAVGVEFVWHNQTEDAGNNIEPLQDSILLSQVRLARYLPPRRIERDGRIALASLPNGRFMAGVAAERIGDGMATALVEGLDGDALLRTLKFALQVTEDRLQMCTMQADVETCCEQLTACLEESVWLRELSLHIEHCAATSSPSATAARILPGLQKVIDAESLIFLVQGQGGDAACQESAIVCTAGETLPVSFCTSVVEAWEADALHEPVVVNPHDSQLQTFEGHALNSLILVPVQHHADRFGWLLAVNRKTRLPDSVDAEFGTVEASMLQAAGVFLATHAHNDSLFQQKEELVLGMILSLVRTLEARDAYTQGHSDRVATFSRLLSRELGMTDEDSRRIHLTGLLHDIGKIGIPDETLNKPAQLNDADLLRIKAHPMIGVRILSGIPSLSHVLPGILHHHERMDGGGYPHGLKGEAIPYDARILAVADGFDAMTSDRPYRRGMPFEKAASILREGAGTQWDPVVVEAFLRTEAGIRAICGTCRSADDSVQNCLSDVENPEVPLEVEFA